MSRFAASCSIRGVYMRRPTKHWQNNHDQFADEFEQRKQNLPTVFDT